MRLHEIAKQPYSHVQIKKWLDKHKIKNYTIRPDGVVDVNGTVDLANFERATIPIQFGRVEGDFSCVNAELASLNGMPSHIGKSFRCFNVQIKSFSGVDKIIKYVGGAFLCDETTHLLGLLLIKGIKKFNIGGDSYLDNIFDKYVGTGDILSAQDELIDAGFIDQARL
jgi:hypothetical protein